MTGTATGLGTFSWVDRTGGQLSAAERRSLLRPLAQGLAVNAAGRLLMLVKLNSGRRAQVVPTQLLPPSSALTRAAEVQAHRRLSPALLNHSYRTFAFGAALGALENLAFDRELLFAAALLHDVGLPTAVRQVGAERVPREPAGRRRPSRTRCALHCRSHVSCSLPVADGSGEGEFSTSSWNARPYLVTAAPWRSALPGP